ncbi:DNA starvation/stationary phase protection protein Dps [Brooklawnia cerclae]|uniref:Starvation-inducible DNA-binding protein n=1 Tax=Brooklawnia cerclae TaxID=349934 RepID=A0ABX0SGM9_9ACTN|nr:DNA starvation/stationary phase protection protein [Brooklawnia cerclae]NIH57543.1 starvation-inducible DNA-binding protein [Brooklawnia cerclae]
MTDVVASKGVSTETVSSVEHYLAPVVVELTALHVNGKQAHWHVRGLNFEPVHELLDDVVDHAREWADLAAERVVALGLPIDGRLSTVAAQTKTPELSAGFQPSEKVIHEVIEQIDVALAVIHAAVEGLGEVDASSQDVAIEIERGLQKDRWFLFAHVAA